MAIEKILTDFKNKKYSTIYWLEGEEEYYIDKVLAYAESNILTENEASFNQTVFYGRDSNWADILNACRRYPMFSEKQLIIIKEAQHLKDIDKLEPYIANPLNSTILIIAYKDKKQDARTKFAKLLKDKGIFISTKKMYESALPEWVNQLLKQSGHTISPKANALLVDHIGNDLSRIENEIEKILINLKSRKTITEEDIENYVGISKDFNSFELQSAIATKDLPKAIRIIQYFDANPKAAPIQLILPSLYSFFSKVYMIFGTAETDDTIARQLGINPYFFKSYMQASKIYGYTGVEKVLLLLHQYNLKSIGINTAKVEDAALLKEMTVKMML